MPFKIVRNDLTKMETDAIVNTANEEPIFSTGTDSAVYMAAGAEALLKEREKIGRMEEGQVAITPGFNLPAKYIIHAVSPCYIDGTFGEEEKLRACYRDSLQLAKEYGCKSIAFPLIATGGFGYPKKEGFLVAIQEITAFLLQNEMLVYLVVFDEESTHISKSLYPDLESYIDNHYVEEAFEAEYQLFCEDEDFSEYLVDGTILHDNIEEAPSVCYSVPKSEKKASKKVAKSSEKFLDPGKLEIEDYYEFVDKTDAAIKERLKHVTDTFQEYLFYLIETKGLSNSEVYKRASVTKQLFSKIKLNADYHPDKETAMKLCVGAMLNLDETTDLLGRAGFALSKCNKKDVIYSYFVENKIYDLLTIDLVLEEYGLPCFIDTE